MNRDCGALAITQIRSETAGPGYGAYIHIEVSMSDKDAY